MQGQWLNNKDMAVDKKKLDIDRLTKLVSVYPATWWTGRAPDPSQFHQVAAFVCLDLTATDVNQNVTAPNTALCR